MSTFNYASNGRLTVGASLPGTGRHARTTIQRSSGLTEGMLVQWEQRIEEGELLVEAVAEVEDVAETSTGVGEGAEPIDVDELDDFEVLDEDAKDKAVDRDDPELDDFLKGLGD